MEVVTVEMNENLKEDGDSIDKEKEVTSEINFVAIKEEPYNEEENYVDENTYEEEFPFLSCGIKHEGPSEGGAEEAAKGHGKTCSEENIKTEEPETQEQQQLSDYDPLNPVYLCEVTFGRGNANSRYCRQAEATAQTNQASSTAGTIIKEEVSLEDAEDKQPKTEVTEMGPPPAKKLKKGAERLTTHKNIINLAEKLAVPEKITLDNFGICGNTVGLALRKLNEQQQAISQKLISEIIFLAKMNCLTEDTAIVCNQFVPLMSPSQAGMDH